MPDFLPSPTEAPQSPQLQAEMLVAMTGIFIQRAPSELEVRGARNYPARVRRRLAAFLDGSEVVPFQWDRPPSQKSLMRDLSEPLDHDETLKMIADLDVEVGLHFPITLNNARQYILNKWPRFVDNSLGLHNYELATDEYGDVWHLCRTLDKFESVFDDMDSLLLLPEQVEAVTAVFPELMAMVRATAMLLVQPFVSIDGITETKKSLAPEREEQLRTLLGVPNDAPIQAETAETKTPAKRNEPREPQNDSDLQTPSERIARNRVR